jgi:hypothetical protein
MAKTTLFFRPSHSKQEQEKSAKTQAHLTFIKNNYPKNIPRFFINLNFFDLIQVKICYHRQKN